MLDLERRLAAGEPAAGDGPDEDPAFQLAMTRLVRVRILNDVGRPDLTLEPLGQAIADLRALADQATDPDARGLFQGNLSAALGDLANAQRALGRTDAALAAADEGIAIDRALGNDRNLAAGLGRTAAILMAVCHHTEAEARYGEALAAAGRIGDLELQGTLTQHLGVLQRDTGRPAEAVETLKRALRLLQQTGDREGEMRTCDLLGSAEMTLGRLDPAEAWYRRALNLAGDLAGNLFGDGGDQGQIGVTRQNLGILFQTRAEQAADDAARDHWLAAELLKALT